MNLQSLAHQLGKLSYLLSLKTEQDDERRLADILIILLAAWYKNGYRQQFYNDFLQALRNFYLSLVIARVGESEAWTSKYQDLIDAEIDTQSQYLDGFADDLENTKISEAQAKARTRQYASSLGKFDELVQLEQMGLDTMARWDRNPELENCPDCLELDGQIHTIRWYIETGHTPKSEMQRCGHNCGCAVVPV